MFSDFILFRRNVSWLSVAEVTRMICWWGVLIVIGKLLGVEAVGQFGLAMALTAPIMMFMNLGLRSALATDVANRFSFQFYSSLRIATNGGFAVVALGLAMILGYAGDELIVIVIFGIYRIIQAQSDICFGLFQKNMRLDLMARSILIRSPLALVFTAIGITTTGRLIEGLYGLVFAELLVFLLYDRTQLPRFLIHESDEGEAAALPKGRFRKVFSIFARKRRALGSLALQAFPLGLAGLLGSLQLSLPRLVVEDTLGLAALGYFTAISAFYAAITRVVNTLGHAAVARLALDYRDGKWREYLVLLGIMGVAACIVGSAATIVAFTFGGELLGFLFTADYAAYETIFGLVMIAACFRLISNLWQVGIVASRRFWLNGSIHLLVTLVIASTAPLLVKEHALTGAAWS
ncbi:MAG: lipopolysaccharide biosynthesis protein, partial [Planctomycetota bacterium]